MKRKREENEGRTWLERCFVWVFGVILCLLLAMVVWNVYLQLALERAQGRVFILELQTDRLLSMIGLSYEVNAIYSRMLEDDKLSKPFENWAENEANIRYNYNIVRFSEYPQEEYDRLVEREAEMVASGKYR
jgi:hypothetical protein